MKTFLYPLLLLILATSKTYTQSLDSLDLNGWKQFYTSDSIPRLLIYRLGRFNDGYFPIIADRDSSFEATDVISNSKLPTRQLRYLGRNRTSWIMTYKHGGWGLHYHFVFYKVEDGTVKALISGVTGEHLETLEDIRKAISNSAIHFMDLSSKEEMDKL